MARKLKVWGGSLGDGVRRGLVAATTKKRAVELVKKAEPVISYYYFNDYWTETGNDVELAVATEEGVWATISDHGVAPDKREYKRLV
jgi:hypothetical protein